MHLYKKRIPIIASAIIRNLVDSGSIEVGEQREAEMDVASVLNTYVDTEQQVAREARDILRSRGLPQHELGRVKRLVAERHGLQVGDEALDYVRDQLLAMLWHSPNVEELFVEDVEIRRRMATVLKREDSIDEQLDREVRSKLRHLQEGTDAWEIEYRRVMEQVRRRKGV